MRAENNGGLTENGLLTTYRDLLAAPGARALATASLVSKFPVSMFPVSIVLLLSPRYSYAAAGTAIGAMLLANAASSPLRGRLLTRHPVPVVLRLCLVGYVAGLAGLALTASAQLPQFFLVLCAVLTGSCVPPVGLLLRGSWTAVAGVHRRSSSNSFEAATMDVALITGPVLATWLGTSATPFLPLAVIGVFTVAAVALVLTVYDASLSQVASTAESAAASRGGRRPLPLRSRHLAAVLGAQLLFCAALSGMEVALPIYAQQHQITAYSGWYLSGLSIGSIVGALLLGGSAMLSGIGLPVLLGAFVAGAGFLGIAMNTTPWAVLFVCPVAGLAIGSTFSCLYTGLAAFTPPGAENETQGWAASMTTVGFAVGSSGGAALAGAHGASFFLPLSLIAGAAAALVALGATDRHRLDETDGAITAPSATSGSTSLISE